MFFSYAYDAYIARPLRLIGVREELDGVRLRAESLIATFGFLNAEIRIANVASSHVTGPYRWWTALGPRLSFADHGATFGTNTRAGVCLRFLSPIEPLIGPWAHPGLTVTVADPEGLVKAITEHCAALPERTNT